MPKTTSPVTFNELQQFLNQLGYVFKSIDQKNPVIHWERTENGMTSGMLPQSAPKELTIIKPDFLADGYTEYVYDRHWVMDLLSSLLGVNRSGKGTLALLACLKKSRGDQDSLS